MTPPLPFDSIVLVEGEVSKQISSEELAAMRMQDRVTAILENRLKFYLGDVIVPVIVALKALRARAHSTDGETL